MGPHLAPVDKSKLMAFQIHVNPLSPRSGTAAANPFDCYIDDVHFLSEPAPTTPATTVTWTTAATRSNATVRLQDPRARSSLDGVGLCWLAITREDIPADKDMENPMPSAWEC